MTHFERSPGHVEELVNIAHGLPNEFYTDRSTFAAEKKAVFFENWAGIGFGKDIPEPGDAMPVEFLGMPLLAVRDRRGSIKVFQNTCRHRGMILVQEKTRIRGAIRCPYHSWCYGLDGALRGTPHVGGPGQHTHEDIKRDELGLWEIRSHVWRDIILVNVSGEAPTFEEYAADLIKRWIEFEQPLYHGGNDSSFKLELRANWKLAVENYCESYHLPCVHPGLNSYSRLEDHYNIEVPGECSGQGTLVYRPMIGGTGNRFTDFAGLGEKWATGGEYVALYPNLLLGVHRDHAFAIVVEPIGPGRTVEHVELYYASDEMRDSDWSGMRVANARMWQTVFEEDVFVVEGMQKGRHGVKFDGGRFSPAMDGPTLTFHRWVAERFSDDRVDAGGPDVRPDPERLRPKLRCGE